MKKKLITQKLNTVNKLHTEAIEQYNRYKKEIDEVRNNIFNIVNTNDFIYHKDIGQETMNDSYNILLRSKLCKLLKALYIYNFHEGIAVVRKGKKWFYIDRQGKEIIKENDGFDWAGHFHEGIAVVRKGKKCFYIDKKGNKIMEGDFDIAENFYAGIAKVKRNGQYFYIDKQGQEITKDRFDEAGNFCDGVARVRQGKKWFYIDRQGNKVFE